MIFLTFEFDSEKTFKLSRWISDTNTQLLSLKRCTLDANFVISPERISCCTFQADKEWLLCTYEEVRV
jgi:hypothetical protein